VFQLVGDLEEVAHDNLIVRCALRICVDCFGYDGGLGRWRWTFISGYRKSAECGARESHPQLRTAETLGGRNSIILLQQLEPLVRNGMEPHVIPGTQLFRRAEPEGFSGAIGLHGQRLQHVGDLSHAQAAMERHGAQMVAMQSPGELGQQRVLRVRGNAFNDELLPRDPQRERGAIFEQTLRAPRHPPRRRSERGVSLRIHRVLVERDGQLDEEVGQLSREGRLFRRGGHGVPK